MGTEELEPRVLLSTVRIDAAGAENTESMALLIDGAVVKTWDNIGGDASAGQFEVFEWVSDNEISADQIRIAFTNDVWEPENDFDTNLRIDAVTIDQVRFEAEDPGVFSTGTWRASEGITPGFLESEWLHSDGFFQFTAAAENTRITVVARGSQGDEAFAIDLAGERLAVRSNIGTEDRTFQFSTPDPVSVDQLRVAFLNDEYDPANGIDANLIVDYITIDGERFETESSSVFSTGTWREEDGVTPGFRESEWLHATGYFQYASEPFRGGLLRLANSQYRVAESVGELEIEVVREGGSQGIVTVDYVANESTAKRGEDFVAQQGTLLFEEGELSKTLRIQILDDSVVEADKEFNLIIENVTGNAGLSAPRTAIITIDDDDSIEANGDGVFGEYFENQNLTDRFATRLDPQINFAWETDELIRELADGAFSVRWTGELEPRFSETYTFDSGTSGAVRLWIDDRLLIDTWSDPANSSSAEIDLQAGVRVNFRLEYLSQANASEVALTWASVSQTEELIPTSQLYAAEDPGIFGDELTAETIVSGLNRPTAIRWTPDGANMFISEQRGIVRVVREGVLQSNPFIDIQPIVNNVRDRGLLGMEVHPDFENNPYVYLLFTYDPPEVFENVGDPLAGPDQKGNRAGRLIRVTADAETNYTTAVAGSEVILLGKNSTWANFNAFANSTDDMDEPPAGIDENGTNVQDFIATDSESHSVGALQFGLDGSLFVSIGDGTSYNRVDPRTVRVQDIDNLSGKVLRIDPLTGQGLEDNPFYNEDPDANRSKVYYLGLRNPFRLTVDSSTGQLFVGDVGWNAWEEVNTGPAGTNFGWPYFEGGNGVNQRTNLYRDLPAAQEFYTSDQEATPAIFALSHSADQINAIIMGDVYRGTTYPADYQGYLFVNDLGRGIVRAVEILQDGTAGEVKTFTTGANIVVQMVQGPDGNMYFVDLNDNKVGRWVFA